MTGPARIDHQLVAELYRQGSTACEIGFKIGCSKSGVLRILHESRLEIRPAKPRSELPRKSRPCSVSGCDEPHWARGLCQLHYNRLHFSCSWGSIGGLCAIEGCGKPHYAKSYCRNHYRHFKENGDPMRARWQRHGFATPGNVAPEYRAWLSMKGRCRDKGRPSYGGRGIKVCDRWLNSFQNFLQDVGPKPSSLHTLDRKDNDGNYDPDNARWVLPEQQQNNKRTSRIIEFGGRRLSLAQWAREVGITQRGLVSRLDVYGWPLERALTEEAKSHAR